MPLDLDTLRSRREQINRLITAAKSHRQQTGRRATAVNLVKHFSSQRDDPGNSVFYHPRADRVEYVHLRLPRMPLVHTLNLLNDYEGYDMTRTNAHFRATPAPRPWEWMSKKSFEAIVRATPRDAFRNYSVISAMHYAITLAFPFHIEYLMVIASIVGAELLMQGIPRVYSGRKLEEGPWLALLISSTFETGGDTAPVANEVLYRGLRAIITADLARSDDVGALRMILDSIGVSGWRHDDVEQEVAVESIMIKDPERPLDLIETLISYASEGPHQTPFGPYTPRSIAAPDPTQPLAYPILLVAALSLDVRITYMIYHALAPEEREQKLPDGKPITHVLDMLKSRVNTAESPGVLERIDEVRHIVITGSSGRLGKM